MTAPAEADAMEMVVLTVEIIVAWIGAIGAIIAAAFSWRSQVNAAQHSASAAKDVAKIAAATDLAANDKTVFVGSVTAERTVWRSELRMSTSSLVASLRVFGEGEAIEWEDVFRRVSEVALRLNPLGRSPCIKERDEHPLDRDIHLVLDEILRSPRSSNPQHIELASRLEESVALLLKQEWSVSKKEAESGNLNVL